ncbi:MAG: hypothetical protein H6850_03145 [Alphaproteobacteria bacterium]|nr:MAG: hypothetical protein H6850_03145 [Alphaproteobacteria bacterium]
MSFYIPKSDCSQLTFVDFLKHRHTPIPETTKVIGLFSAYRTPGDFELSVLYHRRNFYIENFDFSCLPAHRTDDPDYCDIENHYETALILPYDCPTPNLPYNSEFVLQGDPATIYNYKDFWKRATLTPYFSQSYFYDPKRALKFTERLRFYGNLEFFENFFKSLLKKYKNIIVSSSFWDLHGFGYVTRNFRNTRFKKDFPTLDHIMEQHTHHFAGSTGHERIHNVHHFLHHLKRKHTPCPLPCISLEGIINWNNAFEVMNHYTYLGGRFCWEKCQTEDEGCDTCDPSIVTLCPKTFIKLLDDKKALRILT